MPIQNLRIIIQHLGRNLASGKGNYFLDCKTGKMLDFKELTGKEAECGEGRPAVAQGKRFIRIPSLDEMYAELKKQVDNVEAPEDEAFARFELFSKKDRADFLEFCDFMRGEQAEGEMALRWISSLRPPFQVEMMDELTEDEPDDPCILGRYDPGSHKWSDA